MRVATTMLKTALSSSRTAEFFTSQRRYDRERDANDVLDPGRELDVPQVGGQLRTYNADLCGTISERPVHG